MSLIQKILSNFLHALNYHTQIRVKALLMIQGLEFY